MRTLEPGVIAGSMHRRPALTVASAWVGVLALHRLRLHLENQAHGVNVEPLVEREKTPTGLELTRSASAKFIE